jgi:predicted Zn-dependent protease
LAEEALGSSAADQTEVALLRGHETVTRFTSNFIHQNTAESSAKMSVRAIVGKKTGCAETSLMQTEDLRQAVERALSIARAQKENPELVSLPAPGPIPGARSFYDSTAGLGPQLRAEIVKAATEVASQRECLAAGALTIAVEELAVANSVGVRAYHSGTRAQLTVLASEGAEGLSGYERASGFAQWTGPDMGQLDARAIATKACDKCLLGRQPVGIEPGEYTVILEPEAVGELVAMLGWLAFGARAVQEGRSFLSDRLGQKVVDERISIWDDGADEGGIPLPFDFEGVGRKRVDLIREGIAAGYVHDSYTAAKEGKESTGHASPPPWQGWPMPSNMFMAEGEQSLDEMVASTDRGLLVTRLHYVNAVKPKETVLTGMTRDGTFLIENGRLTKGIRNMRFTDSVLEMLSRVEAVGNKSALVSAWICRAPALKLSAMRFTSAV